MPRPNSLQMHCSKCKVADNCPKRGASPVVGPDRKPVLCKVVGGYGRLPVDQGVLSEGAKKIIASSGPCLTVAEVPLKDEPSGKIYFETVKIFHHPITHPREKTDYRVDIMLQRSHKQ